MASSLLVPVSLLMNQMNLADLEAVQSHAASLISGLASSAAVAVAVAVEEKLLTPSQLRQKAIEVASNESKPYKAAWRKLVTRRNVLENVFGILEDCYPSLRSKSSNEYGWKAARALGSRQTVKWQEFKLSVFFYLYKKGSFGSLDSEMGFNDFEDTAGGCDEIAWDAAYYLLSNPDWAPSD